VRGSAALVAAVRTAKQFLTYLASGPFRYAIAGPPPAGRVMYHLRYMDYGWYMAMKRTNVYADPEDLAIIKEAAARRGISEAEIIRQGIHLAAMANRVWDEPLFSRTFQGPGRTPSTEDVRNAVADAVQREDEPRTAS
jgi:Ribbon-helix-helix protein, copG family